MTPIQKGLVFLARAMDEARRAETQERLKAMQDAGAALRIRREGKRMTLRALAEALDVSAPFLVDVEHGRRRLSEEHALKADDLLGEQS